MTATVRRTVNLIRICVAAFGVAIAGHAATTDLRVTAAVGYQSNGGLYFVEITNKTGQFICLDEAQFDTGRDGVQLKSTSGSIIAPRRMNEPSFSNDLGFNANYSYAFVKPKASRKVYLDMANYNLVPGTYKLQGIATYHYCAEIIDLKRIAAGKELRELSLEYSGVVTFPFP